MNKIIILFLQAVIVLLGIVVLAWLIWFPMTEGRAANLDLFSIYLDPFILYGYASSIVFFVALYNGFKLLGYIGQNNLYSLHSIKSLRRIKYCAIILSILIVLAGLFIKLFHNEEDDPAGFLAMCIIITIMAIAVAIAVAGLEEKLQNTLDLKSENDLLM